MAISSGTMITIVVERFEAFIFDLDGVITQTDSVHARAWKQLFDEILGKRATQTGAPFVAFDLETDYRRYVDGKPRIAGVLDFLAARGIDVPVGEPGIRADPDTAHSLARCKDHYFSELLAREGVQVFDSGWLFSVTPGSAACAPPLPHPATIVQRSCAPPA